MIVLSGCAIEAPAEWDRPDATDAGEDARVAPSRGPSPASVAASRAGTEDEAPRGAELDRGAALPTPIDDPYEACLAEIDRGASSCVIRDDHGAVWAPDEPLLLGPPYRGWTLEVRTRGGAHHVRLVAPSRRAAYPLGRVAATRGCTEEGRALRDRHAVPPHWRERRAPPAIHAGLAAARVEGAGAIVVVDLDEAFVGCGDCGCACGSWGLHPVRRAEPVRLLVPRAARSR